MGCVLIHLELCRLRAEICCIANLTSGVNVHHSASTLVGRNIFLTYRPAAYSSATLELSRPSEVIDSVSDSVSLNWAEHDVMEIVAMGKRRGSSGPLPLFSRCCPVPDQIYENPPAWVDRPPFCFSFFPECARSTVFFTNQYLP